MYVFSWRLKVSKLSSGSRRLSGSEFQVDGPATEKAPTTETVQSIARYDQLPLSGRTQMLTASDFCCECTTVHQVRRSSSMETSIHEHCELKSYSIGDIKPVELVMHLSRQTTVVLPSVTDDTGSWIHHSLQLVCYDFWRLSQHSVTVVDTRCHKCLHEGFWPTWHTTTAGHDKCVWDERSK